MKEENESSPKKPILQIIVNKVLSSPNQTINKSSGFIESLISKNKKNLSLFSENGLPDEIPILRSIVWKINLGYLPIDNEQWENILKSKRTSYFYYKEAIKKIYDMGYTLIITVDCGITGIEEIEYALPIDLIGDSGVFIFWRL